MLHGGMVIGLGLLAAALHCKRASRYNHLSNELCNEPIHGDDSYPLRTIICHSAVKSLGTL